MLRRETVGRPSTGLLTASSPTTPVDEVLAGNQGSVVPLFGFEWGFMIRSNTTPAIELLPVAVLASSDWTAHVPLLSAEYPAPFWTFAESM